VSMGRVKSRQRGMPVPPPPLDAAAAAISWSRCHWQRRPAHGVRAVVAAPAGWSRGQVPVKG
jgi:hypothetical protein